MHFQWLPITHTHVHKHAYNNYDDRLIKLLHSTVVYSVQIRDGHINHEVKPTSLNINCLDHKATTQ